MEVPLPLPRDQRAWDAVIRGPGWIVAVEAETRPRDVQALERRIALKMRDSGVDEVVLLLLLSRHNARLLREHDSIRERFPLEGPVLLGALHGGDRPGGSGILLL